VDVDRGQLVYPSLEDVPFIVYLHEISPVGGWAPGGRDGRRLERLAEVGQWLTSRGQSHPGLRPLANLRFEVSRLLPAVFCEPDVATTPRALKGKLLTHAGHEFGPRNPGSVVGAGLLMRVTAVPRGVTVAPVPAGRGLAPLATESRSNAKGGRAQYLSKCSRLRKELGMSRSRSVIRTLASTENPLFSQASMSATAVGRSASMPRNR
jgi:hypothetical protein